MITCKKVGFTLIYINTIIPLFSYTKKCEPYRCMDYYSLNNNATVDRYPISRIHDILGCVLYTTIFRKIYLVSRYYQAEVYPDYRLYGAF